MSAIVDEDRFFVSEVTLSALNSPELDVDIEDLEDSSSPGKKMKLAFESGKLAMLLKHDIFSYIYLYIYISVYDFYRAIFIMPKTSTDLLPFV